MLEAALTWMKPGLRKLPLVGRAARILRYYQLCCGPYAGQVDRVRRRFEALHCMVGPDRLPLGSNPPRLAEWLDALNRLGVPAISVAPKRVLFVSVMAHWVDYCLPVAIVLAGRGHSVDYAWLPYRRMEVHDANAELHPAPAPFVRRLLPFVAVHPRLRLVNLRHVAPARATPEMRRRAEESGQYDTRYLLRRECIDFQTEQSSRALAAFRAARNLDCLRRLQRLLQRKPYDSVVVPNGAVFEFAMAYQLARRAGLDCVTFDFGERKGTIIASRNQLTVHQYTDHLWRADEPHLLTPERETRVVDLLLRRELPNWEERGYTWHGQLASLQPDEELRAALGLSREKPTALLCTNVAHDTAVLGRTRAFVSMAQWIRETVRWFASRPDWQLVIRCHPVEAHLPSGEPVPELVARWYPDLPNTIRVVRPEEPVNTYGLVRLCNLGLVYTTTTGLEMAARGLPVIVAGEVHYAGKGFTNDPTTPAEYFATLERVARGGGASIPTPRQVELARCYADVYFERLPKAFPWNIDSQAVDMELWPLDRILVGDCPAPFLETLDYLAGAVSD
jgi:hypothetical protein